MEKPTIVKKTFTRVEEYFPGVADTITEERFVIVDADGVIIDNAQGYGYKTYQKALKAYYFKKNKPKIDKDTKTAKRLVYEHYDVLKKVLDYTLDEALIACKDGEKFKFDEYFWSFLEQTSPEVYKIIPEDKYIRKSIIKVLS